MNKDVIYIDVEDDITAIIGKIKASKEKIVALVPPRHSTVLQSAVNLRLLERMAKGASKQLVVVTNNQALVALASAASIPVAKNLQSKPEIAEIPALAVDDDDDIIDGSQLPVGEHAATAPTREPLIKPKSNVVPVVDRDELENIDIDGEPVKAGASAVATKSAPTTSKKPKSKIPNFNSFRKKLFFGILGVAAITGLLIWMYVFAPAATITVTAKAAATNINATVTLGDTQATDFSKGIVSSVTQTLKQDNKVNFTPTGTKQIGNKAAGSVKFSNKSISDVTIASGTTITSSEGNNYVTQSAVTVPAAVLGNCGGGSACAVAGQSDPVQVAASDVGAAYNTTSGDTFSVAGQSSNVTGTATTDITGGTSQTVKAVSQSDFDQAKAQLQGTSQDAVKKQLQAKFTSDQIVIGDSFTVTPGDATSSPAVGEALPDGTSQATLTVTTTYTLTAVPKSAAQTYVNDALTAQISDKTKQRIYQGNEKLSFSNYTPAANGVAASANINAVGYIGPNLQAADIKKQVAGQKTGQVQATLDSIDGVNDVNVKYSYFWVDKVPSDPNKVTVEFKISS